MYPSAGQIGCSYTGISGGANPTDIPIATWADAAPESAPIPTSAIAATINRIPFFHLIVSPSARPSFWPMRALYSD
jgi:hypothetical protein